MRMGNKANDLKWLDDYHKIALHKLTQPTLFKILVHTASDNSFILLFSMSASLGRGSIYS